MISHFIFFTLFWNVVLCLQCKTVSNSGCIYNSTCQYKTIECQPSSSSSLRTSAGYYCTTLARKENDSLIIELMDCGQDQEVTKTCKNQTECLLKYITDRNQYLHCCCNQQFCNYNFSFLDVDNSSKNSSNQCKDWLCSPMSLALFSIPIGMIFILIILSFICRKKILRYFYKCFRSREKFPSKSLTQSEDEKSLINWQINPTDLHIGELIRSGRFSKIHRGTYDNHHVAIKILRTQYQNDEPSKLFEHEKDIYSLPFLNHRNILRYYGYCKLNSDLCLVNDLSVQGSLRDVLRSRLLKNEKELLFILKEISEGVDYLHKTNINRPSIAHRDLKTENILYLNQDHLVLSDFAMSTIVDQDKTGPNQSQQIGTARYMSPEILAGTIGNEIDALLKCDVYALGIIFWEILSRYPFTNGNDKYIQPFEYQLNENNLNVNNPSINDMLKIIHLPPPSNRPLINPIWKNCNYEWVKKILLIIEACWDDTPESRISSGLINTRIQQIII